MPCKDTACPYTLIINQSLVKEVEVVRFIWPEVAQFSRLSDPSNY